MYMESCDFKHKFWFKICHIKSLNYFIAVEPVYRGIVRGYMISLPSSFVIDKMNDVYFEQI